MTVDVLAIGPHPDDIEMTCAGLLIKMRRKGYRTAALHLTRGEMGSRGSPEEREREARAAAAAMEVDEMEILGLRDGHIAVDDSSVRSVAEAVRSYRPRLVIAPFPYDPHPDHARTGQLAAEAIHRAELSKFECRGEPHFTGQLVYAMYRQCFTPTFVVDVTDEFEQKMKAVRCYGSQVGEVKPGEEETRLSSPLFLRQLEARHVCFGGMIGRPYGEPYFCEHVVPLADPVAAFEVPQQRRYAVRQMTPAGGAA